MTRTLKTLAVAAAAVALLASCKADTAAYGVPQDAVVVAVASGSTAGGGLRHTVQCETPDGTLYEVITDAETTYTIPEGIPCPSGPVHDVIPPADGLP